MIIKEIGAELDTHDARRLAGHKNEKEVAFFLRREFAEDNDIFILNDVRIEHKGERAQIDHLVIYPFGFIILESKSIKGRLVVNEFGEWARQYRKEWKGIASPLRQAEVQSNLLKSYLDAHKKQLMGRIFGFLQKGIKGRNWYALCVVSSDALIDRRRMTGSDNERVIKSEFVGAKLRAIVSEENGFLEDGPPRILNDELKKIVAFLNPESPTDRLDLNTSNASNPSRICCRKCHNKTTLRAMSGPYGYYVKCSQCDTNTRMKRRCTACQSPNTELSKQESRYMLACNQCGSNVIIF